MTPVQDIKNIMSDYHNEVMRTVDLVGQFNSSERQLDAIRMVSAAHRDAERSLILALNRS